MEGPFRLQVKFWGVRGSIPTPQADNLGFGGNTTCIEVRRPGDQVLIIDGGTGLRYLGMALMREFAGRRLSLKFLMTHFHWDHIQGIPLFAPLYGRDNAVTFYSDRPAEDVREILDGQMSHPYFPAPFEQLGARRHFEQIDNANFGDVSVRAFPLNHPQGACGYRIESEGAVVVHASDLEHGDEQFDRVLIDHAQNADVLIYDSQYTPEEYGTKRGWGHSTWREAVRVAREAQVKRLVLFHHDPGHDDRFMNEIEKQARSRFENTDAAREGATICV